MPSTGVDSAHRVVPLDRIARERPRRFLILDGYVDEPANFGVPPYISPHARYLAGAVRAATDGEAEVRYATADQWRGHRPGARNASHAGLTDTARDHLAWAQFLVVVAGALVPGVYLRGRPLSWREATETVRAFRGPTLLAGASAMYGFGQGGGRPAIGLDALASTFTYIGHRHADKLLHDVLAGDADASSVKRRSHAEWRRWSVLGADVARQHPDHPQPLIAELDTYHGCVRYVVGGCSFCLEPKEGRPDYRPVDDVVAEVAALSEAGVVNFRLGGQACFYSYQARGLGESATPKPSPSAIEDLLRGIRHACPGLRVLHIDNADPAVIVAHEREAREVTRLLVKYATPGNIAAFGLETADPAVHEANNLNITGDECLHAVRVLNEEGGRRGWNGLPWVLPGINFLFGLWGETQATFAHDKAWCERLLTEGLVVRRINIRKVSSGLDGMGRTDQSRYHQFKEWVRGTVDRPMLARVVPVGTVMRDVYLETRDGHVTFGRQTGSYPLLVGLPYDAPLDRFVDVRITEHGERSVTGVETPFPVNTAGFRALQALPGVGSKRAGRLVIKRPFRTHRDFKAAFDDASIADAVRDTIVLDA